MWTDASTTQIFAIVSSNVGSFLSLIIVAVIATTVGLIGVAYAIRKTSGVLGVNTHWYTGGGFEDDDSLTEADKEYYRKKNVIKHKGWDEYRY